MCDCTVAVHVCYTRQWKAEGRAEEQINGTGICILAKWCPWQLLSLSTWTRVKQLDPTKLHRIGDKCRITGGPTYHEYVSHPNIAAAKNARCYSI